MGKFHYRLPPCPHYDTEGLEDWLADMALRGYFLDPEGYVFRFFQFQKDTPRPVRYRIEPNPSVSGLSLRDPEDPPEEVRSLYAEYGWEYLGQLQDHYIYRTFEPNARELHTDPEVRAMALDPVRKRYGFLLLLLLLQMLHMLLGFFGPPSALRELMQDQKSTLDILQNILLVFASLMILAVFFDRNVSRLKFVPLRYAPVFLLYLGTMIVSYLLADTATPLLNILNRGWLPTVLLGVFFLSCVLAILLSYLHIRALQRRLQLRDNRRPARRGNLLRLFAAVLPVLLLLSMPIAQSHNTRLKTGIPLEDLSSPLPFPTMQALAPEREYIPQGSNGVRIWQDLLFPVNYEWGESAYLDAPDGSRYAGDLAVTYHEAANEAIARRLVSEYSQNKTWDPDLIPETIDTDGLDFLGISKVYHYSALIRKGNTVIYAYCSIQSWGDHESLFPLWLEQMIQTIS